MPKHIIFVEKLEVLPSAIHASVWVSQGNKTTASAPVGFKDRLLAAVPALGEHLCVGEDKLFKEEIADTQTAHLFEHLVLEVIAHAENNERSVAGHTSWDHIGDSRSAQPQERSGFLAYRVSVKTGDDFVGVGAFTIAQTILDWAWAGEGAEPDINNLVAELLDRRKRFE